MTTSAASRRRVLVVDDHPDNRDSLVLLLQLWGHEARGEADGHAALRAAYDFRPHVVLLDIGMPGLNGYDVARQLRAAPGADGFLLIAMTGFGQAHDVARAREAGFDHHFLKPFDPDELFRLLDTLPGEPAP